MNRGKKLQTFDSPWMEAMCLVHPAIPACLFVPVVVYFLAVAYQFQHVTQTQLWICYLGGMFAWTLTEYLIHRIAFHYEPSSAIGKKLHYMIHGIHHDDPNDAMRLVMPPAVSLTLAPIVYMLWTALWGATYGPVWFAGFVTGYLAYDYIHFWTHHGKVRSPVGKFLRRHHHLHHFHNETKNFGVSNPLWDVIFGTLSTAKTHSGQRSKGTTHRAA
jgi:sterol desaturase/sphingolipid hydroxylase (fatty acid hydroxylase superfamily)